MAMRVLVAHEHDVSHSHLGPSRPRAALVVRNAVSECPPLLKVSAEEYYRERAGEYELLYSLPQFTRDLNWLRLWVRKHSRGSTILEVAAGTGYWTRVAAAAAKRVTATDCNRATLEIAARRQLGSQVTILVADAFALPELGEFDMGMAHLWWSHIPRERRRKFLEQFLARLKPGSTVLMIDQMQVKGLSLPASRHDRYGNRYEVRRLRGGRAYEIIKNYPSMDELRDALAPYCVDVRVARLQHFWALHARVVSRSTSMQLRRYDCEQ